MLSKRNHTNDHATLELFKGCTKSERARVEALTTDIHIREGRVLCRQGEIGREAFVIIDGEASVEVDGVKVATLRRNDVFGEMALLDGGPRVATVTAITPMEVLVLNRQEFSSVLRAAPDVATRLLAAVSRRLRDVEARALPLSA